MRIALVLIIVGLNLFSKHFTNGLDKSRALNVLGSELESCCFDPMTGWYRDGYCHTDSRDYGVHVVCAVMTEEFLDFSASCGNDLKTERGSFPGLKEGDKWCLCVSRWKEAFDKGIAPPVILQSTHEKALMTVTLKELQSCSVAK